MANPIQNRPQTPPEQIQKKTISDAQFKRIEAAAEAALKQARADGQADTDLWNEVLRDEPESQRRLFN